MLLVTLGDPHSVNVELLRPLLVTIGSSRRAAGKPGREGNGVSGSVAVPGTYPIVLIGSLWHWRDQTARLGALSPDPLLVPIKSFEAAEPGKISFLDTGDDTLAYPADRLSPAQRGQLALRALEALRAAPRDRRLAVVTAPIDKHAASLAGFSYPGQTEFFEDLWQGGAVMLLAGPRLRVGLVTNHLPLSQVPRMISPELIATKGALLASTLRSVYGIPAPRIGVLALNPHAGDGGLFGDEDQRVVAPGIAEARALVPYARFDGPLPADTAFYRALRGDFDAVLAQYHDQGLGPLKTVHFDDAVNVSGGLRNLRVSPDHGPAADLYLKGTASGRSFAAAFTMAAAHLAAVEEHA